MTDIQHKYPVLLVVDDEEIIHTLSERIFTAMGFKVFHAYDGMEALRAVQNDGLHPTLILQDVVMPDMDGVELITRLLHDLPDLHVLFSSGYGLTDELGALLVPGRIEFIDKPFTKDDLLNRALTLLGL